MDGREHLIFHAIQRCKSVLAVRAPAQLAAYLAWPWPTLLPRAWDTRTGQIFWLPPCFAAVMEVLSSVYNEVSSYLSRKYHGAVPGDQPQLVLLACLLAWRWLCAARLPLRSFLSAEEVGPWLPGALGWGRLVSVGGVLVVCFEQSTALCLHAV